MAEHLVVMGVSGSGKTTVARILAHRLGWVMAEGDEFHPDSNIEKMSAGVPLTDDDRRPWLREIADWIGATDAQGSPSVVACSALRREYRDILREAPGHIRFVHLAGTAELLESRIQARADHFMPATLLDSQLESLEPLEDDEEGVVVSVTGRPEDVAATAFTRLGLSTP
ncbi:gluconokinase [Demequina capsici]|uniref:Gluconokinase n=1 Tax=Demequina capsici TaxID=3075620 RepID=A0AA96J716_9MICO|nr:gluconokinase [Demequina sp. OYTSA14]WNM23593.1 gluconokinase [Demequina sp. OYTSA14]